MERLENYRAALEGPLALVPCVSQTAYERCHECIDEETCGVRLAMKEVRDAIIAQVQSGLLHNYVFPSEDRSDLAELLISLAPATRWQCLRGAGGRSKFAARV